MMNVRNAPHQGILDRDDAQVRVAGAHGFRGILEGRARHGQRMRQGLARSEMGIGAGLALERDLFGALDGRSAHDFDFLPSNFRAFPRSAGVSTLSGTLSTRATATCMPASSARSCSSFSRNSSGDGGKATKRASALRVNA